MSLSPQKFSFEVLKGFILAMLYFTITKANDTTVRNVTLFVVFYTIFVSTAIIMNINTDVVTTAFFTKTIFTLVDERIKKKKEETEKREDLLGDFLSG
jgi:hypothetical protein